MTVGSEQEPVADLDALDLWTMDLGGGRNSGLSITMTMCLA